MSKLLRRKYLFIVILSGICSLTAIFGQEVPEDTGNESTDSKRVFSGKKNTIERAPIEWYKIISAERDTTYLDTTLSIKKHYKFNYLRKDNFELQHFVNTGRPYLELAKQSFHFDPLPHFGAKTRHIGYWEKQDINYYQTPTPLTDLFYRSAFEQGQHLDAFITTNTSPNINLSIAYKGERSLGKFRNQLTSTKSFRGTLSYQHPSQKYVANLHFTDQRILNEENGGLTDVSIAQFAGGDPEFDDRGTLNVNFENAENMLDGKRFYIDHQYRIRVKDSVSSNQFAVGHIFTREIKEFTFDQSQATIDFFGQAQNPNSFRDKRELTSFSNSVYVELNNNYLGKLKAFIKHSDFNYGYNSVFIRREADRFGNTVISPRIDGEIISFGGNYSNTYKGFKLKGELESSISGEFNNQKLKGTAGYKINDIWNFDFSYELTSEAPGFNYQLHQSNYTEYNWATDFENQVNNTFSVRLKGKRLVDLSLDYSILSNYLFFDRRAVEVPSTSIITTEPETTFVSTPNQLNDPLQILKIKAGNTLRFRKFSLDNTLMIQSVSGQETAAYNVPSLVTRNSLFFSSDVFKKAMYLQTGFTFKYYSKYNADGYDPLLSEFYVQNEAEFGGVPFLDFFLNAKVRQTRIFFKLENFQNIFETNDEFLTVGHPTRDFIVRFGLVWNFFL